MHDKAPSQKVFFRILPGTILLLLLCSPFSMARLHIAIGGYFSVGSTWQDGIVPYCGGGETVEVISGATLTGDIPCILGNKTSPVGPAIHLASGSTFTPLSSVTFTLRGYDRYSNTVALIDLGGQFIPQSGSTILSDCATDGSCVIVNNGLLQSVGVTWSIPSSNTNWNNRQSYNLGNYSYLDYYNLPNVWVGQLGQPWISNSEGTGLGSSTDSSVSFTGQVSGTMLTEVASLAQVTSPGTYYISYDSGVVYWYATQGQSGSFTANYKCLSFIGATIESVNNASGNQAIFQSSTFQYMGTLAAVNDYVINAGYKQSNSVGPNQLLKVTNNTFRYCKRIVGFTAPVTGTAADPIILSGNTIYAVYGDAWGTAFADSLANSSYISITDNVVPGQLWYAPFVTASSYAAVNTLTGWVIQNNIAWVSSFEYDSPGATVWPNSVITGNFIMGYSGGFDGREIAGFAGTPGNPTIISNNVFVHPHRVLNIASQQQFSGNYITDYDHHGVAGPAVNGNTQVTNVNVTGNLFTNAGTSSAIQLGYVTRVWLDNITVAQNTSINLTAGGFEFGDQGDDDGSSLMTNLGVYNNLFPSSAFGVARYPDTSTWNSRVHIYRADWHDFYGDTTNYVGINTFSTFTWNGGEYDTSQSRNVTGISLGDTNYSTRQSGLTLTWTYNNSSNVTLSWNGGTAVQLAAYSGHASSAYNNTDIGIVGLYSGTLTDNSQNFTTYLNNPAVPTGMWVKIIGGTGSGQIRRVTTNTPQMLTVVPAWSTVPDSSSSYVLYTAEVKLVDHNGINYVLAGIDLRSTPVVSATDVGIGLQFDTVNLNPEFFNSNFSWRTWDINQGGSGTESSIFTRLSGNPALVNSLMTYERLGYTPKDILLNQGWNGQYIGATRAGGLTPFRP
jgi:hypothetical protein